MPYRQLIWTGRNYPLDDQGLPWIGGLTRSELGLDRDGERRGEEEEDWGNLEERTTGLGCWGRERVDWVVDGCGYLEA